MDLAAEKKESEINNKGSNVNTNNSNSEIPQEIVDSSVNKEAEERQACELKAGLHPLKVQTMLLSCVVQIFVGVIFLARIYYEIWLNYVRYLFKGFRRRFGIEISWLMLSDGFVF